jgi:hypothetical protein
MANKKLRIFAPVNKSSRALLIRMCPPTLPNVFGTHVTWAYGVKPDASYPSHEVLCHITGIHRTPHAEILLCSVVGNTLREDGKPFHITLATSDGVPPAAALDDFNPGAVEVIAPISLTLQFKLEHAVVSHPTQLRRAA